MRVVLISYSICRRRALHPRRFPSRTVLRSLRRALTVQRRGVDRLVGLLEGRFVRLSGPRRLRGRPFG